MSNESEMPREMLIERARVARQDDIDASKAYVDRWNEALAAGIPPDELNAKVVNGERS